MLFICKDLSSENDFSHACACSYLCFSSRSLCEKCRWKMRVDTQRKLVTTELWLSEIARLKFICSWLDSSCSMKSQQSSIHDHFQSSLATRL
jgi:hypothetical protein